MKEKILELNYDFEKNIENILLLQNEIDELTEKSEVYKNKYKDEFKQYLKNNKKIFGNTLIKTFLITLISFSAIAFVPVLIKWLIFVIYTLSLGVFVSYPMINKTKMLSKEYNKRHMENLVELENVLKLVNSKKIYLTSLIMDNIKCGENKLEDEKTLSYKEKLESIRNYLSIYYDTNDNFNEYIDKDCIKEKKLIKK